MQATRAFAPLAPNRLLFTKLDESVTCGVILNVVHRVRAGVSFLTSGPAFPEAIEPGAPNRIAGLVLAEAGAA